MKQYLTHSSSLLRDLVKFLLVKKKSLALLEDSNTIVALVETQYPEIKGLLITHSQKDFQIFIASVHKEYRCEFLSANRIKIYDINYIVTVEDLYLLFLSWEKTFQEL